MGQLAIFSLARTTARLVVGLRLEGQGIKGDVKANMSSGGFLEEPVS